MPSKKYLTVVYETDHSVEEAFETLLDLKAFGKHHPFKMVVTEVKRNSDVSVEYNIVEEAWLMGFIKMHPVYNAEVIAVEKNKQVRYLTQVKKNIHLKIDFSFSSDKNSKKTLVTEELEVTGNGMIAGYFMGVLKKSHVKLFANMGATVRDVR